MILESIIAKTSLFQLKYNVSSSKEQYQFWVVNNFSAAQIPLLLHNPKFRCCINNSPPFVPVLIQINPVQATHAVIII